MKRLKTLSILLITLLLLSGCQATDRRLAEARLDAQMDQVLAERVPQSLQYAELIGPSSFRIHNLFQAQDGRMIDLGKLDIALGQVIEVEGPQNSAFSYSRTEIERVEEEHLFLRTVWLMTDGEIIDSRGSLPIRRKTTEPGSDGNAEKPPGVERES